MNRELESRSRAIPLLTVLLCCSGGANAQGWYVGASIGQSRADNFSVCSSLTVGGFSCTDSNSSGSIGWRAFTGYEISQNLAVEGGYIDLGEFHVSAINSPNQDTATGIVKPNGLTIDAVLTLPASEQFGVLVRFGVFAWSLDTTVSTTRCCGPTTFSVSASGTSVDFGAGVKYDFDKNLGVRAEYQRFANIGNDATGKSDVSLISASLIYRFHLGSSFY